MKTFFCTPKKYCFALLSLIVATTAAMAAESTTAAANKSTCSKFAGTTQSFILVLSSGDNLLESITQCAKDAKLMGASISGLGQIYNPTLSYFTSNPKDKPTLTAFPGYYELSSLNGNITNNLDKYYTHAHAVLADKKFLGIAGHVNEAKVGLTAEITITPLPASLQRAISPKTGFGPIVN